MKSEAVAEIVTKFAAGLPAEVAENLEDVSFIVCQTVADVVTELQEDFDLEPLPADMKGAFIGEPMEREESDESEEMENVSLPEGVIVLVADNLKDIEEITLVCLHEIGHALGMDEEDVKALGLGVSQGGNPNDAQSAPSGS